MVVKFGDKSEMEDDIMVLSASEHSVDISQLIYETLTLSVPFKKLHPTGLCNPDVIAKLEEIEIKEEKKETDPRWDKLKDIQKLN